MGTHPIFESDFDCLTEILRLCHELLVPVPTLAETATHLTPTGRTITTIPTAAHLLKVEPINITLVHPEVTDGTTMATPTATPAEAITDQPTPDMVNKCFELTRSL